MRKILAASAAAGLLLANLTTLVGADGLSTGSEATVSEGLYLRAEPDPNSTVVDLLPLGSTVYIMDGPRWVDGAGWYQVEQDGNIGWANGDYIQSDDEAAPADTRTTTSDSTSSRGTDRPTAKVTAGQEALAIDNVRLREEAGTDSKSINVLPYGSLAYVIEGPEYVDEAPWYKVEQDGQTGWVHGDFLDRRDSELAVKIQSEAAKEAARPAPKLTTGKEAVATENVRLRAAPGTDAKSLDVAPYGSLVYVIAGPEYVGDTAWYKVEKDSVTAWIHSDYVEQRGTAAANKARENRSTSSTTTRSTGSASSSNSANSSSSSSSSSDTRTTSGETSSRGSVNTGSSRGGGIVGTAMAYLGSPYVLGGSGPRVFDCSGFTSFVLGQYGINPGRTTYTQWANGRAVSSSNLLPGDLVFFANTFGPGISHVGIYIGGGRMIHAGSERTGVTTSSVWDAYWGAHYAGARRFG